MTAHQSSHDDALDLLAAYALGALEPDELATVQQLLTERPELQQTLAELRGVVQRLPLAIPEAQPPVALRARTLSYALAGSQAILPAPVSGGRPWSWRRIFSHAGALATGMAVVAGLMWGQLADSRQQMVQTQQQLLVAQTELNTLRDEQQRIALVVTGTQQPVVLTGASGTGTVLRTNAGVMVSAQLPALASGRVYQVWAIAGQDAPHSVGTFAVDNDGYGLLVAGIDATAQQAQVFAITEEPSGGSPAPTTPILIVNQTTT